jgi:hypothetical protein
MPAFEFWIAPFARKGKASGSSALYLFIKRAHAPAYSACFREGTGFFV